MLVSCSKSGLQQSIDHAAKAINDNKRLAFAAHWADTDLGFGKVHRDAAMAQNYLPSQLRGISVVMA